MDLVFSPTLIFQPSLHSADHFYLLLAGLMSEVRCEWRNSETSDLCIHPEQQCTCLFVRGSVRSVLYIQLWRNIRTPEMRKPFYCFTDAFVGRLRKPLSHTNRTLEGPNLFCLGLSLGFCLMNKSTFLHTCTPCKSKHRVQVWVCYQFSEFRDDARTAFLSSVVQNMDKQAEQSWKIIMQNCKYQNN